MRLPRTPSALVATLGVALAVAVASQAGGAPTSGAGVQAGTPGVRIDPPVAFRLGFSADAYYATSFNHPADAVNRSRAFDRRDEHGPHLGLAEVWMEMPRRPVGFRLDLDWGPTAEAVNAREPSRADGWEHVQQAFVSASLNRSGSTYVELGKWVSPVGAEGIEPRDNWLASRGLLFTYAGPYTMTGARFTHAFNDTDWITGHVHRGWDAVGDPGHAPGVGLTGSVAVDDRLNVTASWLGGEEPSPSGDDAWMNLLDVVVGFDPTPRWSTSFDVSAATQSGDDWLGLSAMGRYAFTPRQSLAMRGEVLTDDSGIALGTDMTAWSLTLGYKADVGCGWQLTGEYRHDFASEDAFLVGSKGGVSDDEGTVILGASYAFEHAWRR